MDVDINALKGKVFDKIDKSDDYLIFHIDGKPTFKMEHQQDCCENVYIEDIAGDLNDLIGTPIEEAECVSNSDDPPLSEYDESYTWTFYKLGTIKGSVTIRWFGSSNGYYSESVEISDLTKDYGGNPI